MNGPSVYQRTVIRQLATSGSRQVDDISDVDDILTQLEYGSFARAAQLVDAMVRDDRIEGVVSTRIGALKAAPLDVVAADDSDRARELAEQLGGVEDAPGEWDQIFPAATIGELLRFGFMTGVGLAEILWETTENEWRPRLKLWHTQFIRWDMTRRCYMLITADRGEIELPRIDEQPFSDGHWVMWCPYGYQYAWMRGMVRALGRKYVARGWNAHDWGNYNEVHGHPIKKAIHPYEGEDSEHLDFVDSVAAAKANTTIGIPQSADPEGAKYDIALVEATSRSWETFKELAASLNVDVAVMLLGQNLTTEVQGGSFAAAKVSNLVRLDKAEEDAGIAGCLYLQVLTWWALFNAGDAKLAPRPSYQVRPTEDRQAIATTYSTAATAVSTYKAARVPVDARRMLEGLGVPMIEQTVIDAEEAARVAAASDAEGGNADAADDVDVPADDEPTMRDQLEEVADEADKAGAAALSAKVRAILGALIPPTVIERYTFAGFPIAVENPAGSVRVWRDETKPGLNIGTTTMLHDYGFIEGQISGDDEELDVYVGPDEASGWVFVVHQLALPDYKKHDEDKVFIGFSSESAAREAYIAHRNDGARAIGGMSVIPTDRFRSKLRRRSGSGKIRASARGR